MSTASDLKALTAQAAYNMDAKLAFHRVAKKYLRRLATTLALPKGSYEVRANLAGIAVSGEVLLHADHLYVMVGQFSFGPPDRVVLYRGCHGRRDYSGMENHYATAEELVATAPLVGRCQQVMERARRSDPERIAA